MLLADPANAADPPNPADMAKELTRFVPHKLVTVPAAGRGLSGGDRKLVADAHDETLASIRVRLDEPAWLAARYDSPEKSELDRQCFAHTSPVYFDYADKGVLDVKAARLMLRRVEESRAETRARGTSARAASRHAILATYDATARELVRRMNQRGN